jgi:histidinol-phosphate aminotransferase
MRSVVAAMTAYTLERREAEVKLNQNESPFDFPRALKDQVLARAAGRAWNVYPDFESTELREAIARAYSLRPEQILAGNGSNELLAAAIGALVGPGTPVVFPRPTFTLYEKLIAIAGGLPIPIEFDPREGVLPLGALVDAAVEGAVVIVCSPNNPTGGVLPAGGVELLLATGATVLLDAAYSDFDSAPPRATHERLITFSTFSKAWGLAALRLGWLAASPAMCREIRKVRLPYNLNVISETAAIVALENRRVRDANVARVIAERDRLARLMAPLVETFPSAANFIAFRPRRDCREVFEELYARGVLIRDVSAYPRMTNCLRVSVGKREENDRFLTALRELA